MERTPEAMFFDNFAAIGLARQRTLLAPRFAGARTATRRLRALAQYFDAPNGHSTTLDRLLYTDLKTYLVELLMKQDQMSMAASIESRVPFLDHKLVEFAAALPPRLKLRGFTTKWILREAVRSILPAEILLAPEDGLPGAVRRAGCAAGGTTWRATSCWIRARASAASSTPAQSSACSRRIERGAAEGGDAIWSLLNLELWYRTFIDGDGVQTLPDVKASPLAHDALQATA